MSGKIKKIKIDPKVKIDSSSIFIRKVSKQAKEKFYVTAKEKNLQARELFEQMVDKAL